MPSSPTENPLILVGQYIGPSLIVRLPIYLIYIYVIVVYQLLYLQILYLRPFYTIYLILYLLLHVSATSV